VNSILRPYFEPTGEPCLEQSVIVVADVLGFSAMTREVFKNRREREQLMKIHSALDKSLRNVTDPSAVKWFTKLFTDNIVVGYRFIGAGNGAFAFPQACHSIGHFQREMAMEGFFIRGGIAVGQIHMSDTLIYGEILGELQQAEKRALYPRIVLLDSACKHLASRHSDPLLEDIVWTDECDSALFINYLYPLGAMRNGQREAEISKHKELIINRLIEYKSDGRIAQKYAWLTRYHNRFCRTSVHWNSDQYCIEA
jgi:hypothetical protein